MTARTTRTATCRSAHGIERSGRSPALALLVALVALCSFSLLPTPARASTDPVRLGMTLSPPAGSHRLGPLPASTPLTLDVLLAPAHPQVLAKVALAISTPGSTSFRHYLPVRGALALAAPGRRAWASVVSALGSIGLPGARLVDGGIALQVRTSARAAERAFSVSLERWRLPGGRVAYGPTTPPALARQVAREITYVAGLTTFDLPTPLALRGTSHASASGALCAGASATGGLTPSALASAYDLTPLDTRRASGRGVTIGLFELEPFATSDVTRFSRCFGIRPTLERHLVDGGPGASGASGEATSDIETALEVAPRARVAVAEGAMSESGVLDTYAALIEQLRPEVVSTSWGICEQALPAGLTEGENELFSIAAASGESVLASSGDRGSEGCATGWGSSARALAVSDPSSQPFVTAVGGTSLATGGVASRERVWNVPGSFGGSGGGGASVLWPAPRWQSEVSPGRTARLVPDVSAFADSSVGIAQYFGGEWTTYGGTSVSAPIWAGVIALADSTTSCRRSGSVGFANPALYLLASGRGRAVLRDVTNGGNDYLGAHSGSFRATRGFDEASGLGTPLAGALAPRLCSLAGGGR